MLPLLLLSLEESPDGMVEPASFHMAIAATLLKMNRLLLAQKIGAMIKAVAFRAKLGPLYLQHKLFGGAVRVMAIETVLLTARVPKGMDRASRHDTCSSYRSPYFRAASLRWQCRADYGNPNR